MKIRFLAVIVMSLFTMGFKSDKPAYILYNSDGKEVKYSKMMEDLANADIVFFGELHNNPIAHWMELEITKDLYSIKDGELVLAAEMFERDDQLIIDEYLSAYYDASKFEPEVKLWKNYKTDYKPLMQFARDSNLYFVATNVPRRYASMVSKKGFEILDTLSEKAKSYIAPLPIEYDPEVRCYKDMIDMMKGGNDTPAHVNDNLPKAQALKDATMAYSIKEKWSEGKLMIHYNGSYHSRNFEGIIWYLNRYMEGLSIVTIETVNQENIDKLSKENMGAASYIIAVPDNMTSTY